MSFSGREFLDVAHGLMKADPCQEKHHRSAIGRAYYAAFLHGYAFLIEHGYRFDSSTRGVHDEVRRGLEDFFPGIAAHMANLADARNLADYKIPHPNSNLARIASNKIRAASRIIATIDAAVTTVQQ